MTRDVAARLKYLKPACIHSKFFPSILGLEEKMSSSQPNSAIFLTDSSEEIEKKIKTYAFSGGGKTKEEHQKNGANLDIDIPYQYLYFFLEDDKKLEEIREKYGKGEMMTSEVKKILIEVLQKLVGEHQERRKKVTKEMVLELMKPKSLNFKL
jgi:tryptophanyl-tRNA synthetase